MLGCLKPDAHLFQLRFTANLEFLALLVLLCQNASQLALRDQDTPERRGIARLKDDLRIEQGLSIGAVFALFTVAKRFGIDRALGNSQDAKQALWQVLARVIDQGSRLSAVRLAGTHAACDVLGLEAFDEDDLYRNLDWLNENQATIEDRLFRLRHPDGKAQLFLYDVTSSYLEGAKNELAAFTPVRMAADDCSNRMIALVLQKAFRFAEVFDMLRPRSAYRRIPLIIDAALYVWNADAA